MASEWRDIESAPRDGTDIWAFVPDDEPQQVVMHWYAPASMWFYREALLSDVVDEPNQPTHWMPLPPALEAAR